MSKKPKTTDEKPKYERTGSPLSAWIPNDLMEALDKCCARNRRAKTTEVIIALERHLKAEGFWDEGETK